MLGSLGALALRLAFPDLGRRWLYIAAMGMLMAGLALGVVAVTRRDLRFPATLLSSETVLAALLIILMAQKAPLARPGLAVVVLGLGVTVVVSWKRLSRSYEAAHWP